MPITNEVAVIHGYILAKMTIKESHPKNNGLLPNKAAKLNAHRILHSSHKMFHTRF
jgi:hypothetical protein